MISNEEFGAISTLNLEPIKVKLMHPESGTAWSREKVDAIEIEYRRFLYLMKKFPHGDTAPLVDVDAFWHAHILDTMKYAADCAEIFGYFLHHFPYVGMRGKDDEIALKQMGERMRDVYEETFGEPYIRMPKTSVQTGAAFCASAPAAQAAFCASAPQVQAAFCASAPQVQAAFCASAPQVQAAFCASAPQIQAAFCASAPHVQAAFCASAPQVRDAFCASAPQQSFCASAPQAAFYVATPETSFCARAPEATSKGAALPVQGPGFFRERPAMAA